MRLYASSVWPPAAKAGFIEATKDLPITVILPPFDIRLAVVVRSAFQYADKTELSSAFFGEQLVNRLYLLTDLRCWYV